MTVVVVKVVCCIALLMLAAFSSNEALAHSGRTDSSGGHNCNVGSCAGTYHYHNGGYSAPSSPNYYSQGLTNGRAHAEREVAAIQSTSKTAGYQAGYDDAITNKSKNYLPTAPDHICKRSFTFDGGTVEVYESAYETGWNIKCGSIADSHYSTSYASGYSEGLRVKTNALAATNNSSLDQTEDSDNDWWFWAVIGGVYGVPVLWGLASGVISKSRK